MKPRGRFIEIRSVIPKEVALRQLCPTEFLNVPNTVLTI